MKHRGEPWTQSEIEQLKELYQQKIKISEISEKIQRSESAIQKKLKEFNSTNRRIDWSDNELIKLQELFAEGKTYPEIAQLMGKSTRACQAKAIRLGLKRKDCNVWKTNKRDDFWTESEVAELKKLVSDGYSASEISDILGRTTKGIFPKMEQLGLHIKEKSALDASNYRRAYSVDDNYFEDINTQTKAYFLGWLITDGWVTGILHTSRGDINSNTVGIKLEKSDLDVIEQFKSELKTNYPIQYHKARKSKEYINKHNGRTFSVTSHEQYSLEVTSAKMKEDLLKYGIYPHKTYTVMFPEALDEQYYPGFIAGILSGDGSVDVKKNHETGFLLRSSICGTKDLLDGIQSVLVKNISFNPSKHPRISPDSEHLYILELNQTETVNLYKWFQLNGTSLMRRKNEIIETYLKQKPELLR